MAEHLFPLGPLGLVVSPLRRTRETAAPLERRWGRAGRLEPAVAEIPSPHEGLADRGEWLRRAMAGRWRDLGPELAAWRRHVVEALVAIGEPAVVVSHFIAINVAVGEALGDDRVVTFAPDHCSITIVDVDGGRFRLVERGPEATTALL